jgi:sialate O-acetylesterase
MKLNLFIITFFFACFISPVTKAQVKLPYFFSDNMVLQQLSQVNIWGWDKAGKSIKVSSSWSKQTVTTTTNKEGKWKLQLATAKAGGPYTLTINDGKKVTLHNVLLGEVWICSGQSNMEMQMKGFKNTPIIGSNDAILNSTNKNIRLFIVPRSPEPTVRDTCKASQWNEASPEFTSNFSAVGYYFGKELNKVLDVPVGLICSSYGGSPVEAFMSKENLQSYKEIQLPVYADTTKVNNHTPTSLYNGMINPLFGFNIKGCIWYQGESNNGKPDLYEQLFPAMVKEWRSKWESGEFPFYYVQIAPYEYSATAFRANEKSNSAYLRDAQRKDLSIIPNSGMAVIMDLGEARNIHPRYKVEVGNRLALLALGKTYGLKGFEYVSPLYDSLHIDGNNVTVHFKNAANGLTSFGKEITSFEVAGVNKNFYPATAAIINNGVILTSLEVKHPVAVRYAFKDFVVGELFNTEGLPASSFRTDDW